MSTPRRRFFGFQLWFALLAGCAASGAMAATPASGSLSAIGTSLSYSAGPFAANTTASSANPTCSATEFCDDFALRINLPTNHATANPRDVLKISARYPINQNTFSIYLLDAQGRVLDFSTAANDPTTLTIPAAAGRYTVRLVPQQPSAETVSVRVFLLADQTRTASGSPPRYLQVASPADLGNNTAAEMNIGFNPRTRKVLTLGYLQTLRTTLPEDLSPALPEVCDAHWEDVSFSATSQNTNDPILFTDQATGRTLVSQLQAGGPGQSLFAYTDDDGDNWTLSPATLSGGIDHQSVGGGAYAASAPPLLPSAYGNAVYYCSQSVVAAFCIRSDDGGATFGAPATLRTVADCDGFLGALHGHVKVAPDGTVYVPDRNCGGVGAVMVSTDSGQSFTTRRLPHAISGEGDPSVAIDASGRLYFCATEADGRAHVSVSEDQGRTWLRDRDVAYAAGIQHTAFVTAVAGDDGRAACAFIGTKTRGNFQSPDFPGLWYAAIASTTDAGNSWHTAIPTPDDPVQGMGGICLGGATCISNRNLLDFNGVTMDHQGRVLFGYSDGCVGDCLRTGIPNRLDFFGVIINTAAKTTFLRQLGGKSLRAAFDPPEAAPPRAACLAGTRDVSASHLNWRIPDHGGRDIVRYQVYRGTTPEQQTPIGLTADAQPFYNDQAIDPTVKYWYRVTGLNAAGEGVVSNLVALDPSLVPSANNAPTAAISASPNTGTAPLRVTLRLGGSDPDAGDRLAHYRIDFGDGSPVVIGTFAAAGTLLEHRYDRIGRYSVRLQVTDSRGLSSAVEAATEIVVGSGIAAWEWIERLNVRVNTFITSEEKVLTGFVGELPISIDNGGQYRINGGAFTSEPGAVRAGDSIAVRHVSAATENTRKTSLLTVGDYATPFHTVTTSIDRIPDPFNFGEKSNQAPGQWVESEAIQLTGFDAASVVAGNGMEYRINGGTWTRASGTLLFGQTLQVRHQSSTAALGYKKSVISVGGVRGEFVTRTRA